MNMTIYGGDTLELVQMIKALGDDSRLRILNILRLGPLCVCEIEEILEMSQSNVSRHLNKLMNAKIVTFYKEAKFVYYELNQETIENHPFIKEVLDNELDKNNKYKAEVDKAKRFKSDGLSCDSIQISKEKI